MSNDDLNQAILVMSKEELKWCATQAALALSSRASLRFEPSRLDLESMCTTQLQMVVWTLYSILPEVKTPLSVGAWWTV